MSENKLFRQKSLDRVSSPEQLNDYIAVTSPGVWMLLLGIILTLFGAVIWGVFGKLETRVKVPAVVSEGKAFLYVEAENLGEIKPDQKVEIGNSEGSVTELGYKGQKAEDVLGDIILSQSGYERSDVVYDVSADIDVPDGIYLADIVTDSVSPASFLTNSSY